MPTKRANLIFGISIFLAAASTTPALADADRAPADHEVSYFSDSPLPVDRQVPASKLPDYAQRLLGSAPDAPSTQLRTSTPRGYKLRRGGVKGDGKYIYQSADMYAIDASCGQSGCKPKQQVKLRFRENVQGRDSKRWKLTMYIQPYSGPRTFKSSYHYECGVNLTKETDRTCSSWRDDGADRSAGGGGKNGLVIDKSFGRTPNVKKFPMFMIDVKFADGSRSRGDDGQLGQKFRGWDVCVKAKATSLCKTTGKG
ncbi:MULTISPECIES: hypothetical protein [unclassified Streptomyces]|uniref:hypothetical protein n=1 Tax=unclassified Streptomyces TaxID=2593676 RepID=UPI00131A2E4B|nr:MULTISPECIES: hypothetical protein [unclassified Streptomyces]MYQ78361.1 hypothetical protein [Streptomyces sp. SID4923]